MYTEIVRLKFTNNKLLDESLQIRFKYLQSSPHWIWYQKGGAEFTKLRCISKIWNNFYMSIFISHDDYDPPWENIKLGKCIGR